MFDVVTLVTTIPLPPIVSFTDSIKTCSTRHSTHAQHCGPESKQNIYIYYLLSTRSHHTTALQHQMYGAGEEKALNCLMCVVKFTCRNVSPACSGACPGACPGFRIACIISGGGAAGRCLVAKLEGQLSMLGGRTPQLTSRALLGVFTNNE